MFHFQIELWHWEYCKKQNVSTKIQSPPGSSGHREASSWNPLQLLLHAKASLSSEPPGLFLFYCPDLANYRGCSQWLENDDKLSNFLTDIPKLQATEGMEFGEQPRLGIFAVDPMCDANTSFNCVSVFPTETRAATLASVLLDRGMENTSMEEHLECPGQGRKRCLFSIVFTVLEKLILG